jgi:hypothetical protein
VAAGATQNLPSGDPGAATSVINDTDVGTGQNQEGAGNGEQERGLHQHRDQPRPDRDLLLKGFSRVRLVVA